MNRISLFLFAAIVMVVSCNEPSGSDSQTIEADSTSETTAAQTSNDAGPSGGIPAVCLWNEAGLRTGPGRGEGVKWITVINFGEVVTLTGEEASPEGSDRTYGEMTLSGGDQGWSNLYLFAVNADRAASYGDIDIYKRPELTTFTGDQLEAGEIFAVMKESTEPGWLEVYGREKKKKGWIQENSRFTTDKTDVSVAILMSQAMEEKTPKAQEEALQRILSSSTFNTSSLIGLVQSELESVQARAELPANQLYVTAAKVNVRLEPTTESEVLFQAEEGEIGTIIERTPEMIEVNGNTDYWYLININGQEGWVFGRLTSKAVEQ